MIDIIPNVFMIGVQKSATTSVYDWMAQHPDICGPVSMKDTPFFIDDSLYSKGTDFLNKVYKPEYTGQPIVLNGSAHNIYFERSIKRIHSMNPEAKLILILRNPVERALSAYKFAVKRNLEKLSFKKAVEEEKQRLQSKNLKVLSETTYLDHGLYYKQLKRLYKYFAPHQVLVLLYEEVKKNPENTIRKIYAHAGVEDSYKPIFKRLNKTGDVRFKFVKNLIYNESATKKFLIRYILDPIVPYDLKYRIKIFFLKLITTNKKKKQPIQLAGTLERKYLAQYFKDDIEQLEGLIKKDLSHWKIQDHEDNHLKK